MAIFSALNKYSNFGLLIMRAGLGTMMIIHGLPKITGGPEKWAKLGTAMANMGIHFFPTGWGLAAAIAEAIGGVLVVLGLAFRPACLFIVMTMIVAATMHLSKGESLLDSSHAIELAFAFFGLMFMGPGKYSVDKG
ncbi:MAG TPA: DoxX family protein [Flavipsychrobacter sp.]|nr:DoxX family protein [Flavipsychrobacter sp.]